MTRFEPALTNITTALPLILVLINPCKIKVPQVIKLKGRLLLHYPTYQAVKTQVTLDLE